MLRKKFLYIFMLSLFPVTVFSAGSRGSFQDEKYILQKSSEILWENEIEKNNEVIVKGTVKTGFGSFELVWIIEPGKQSKLVTMESMGGGELPLKQKKLLPLPLNKKNTLIFQKWPVLLNSAKPETIQMLVNVNTDNLFSVIKAHGQLKFSQFPEKIEQVSWGDIFTKNEITYLPGVTKSSSGSLNLYWKIENGNIPELVLFNSKGGGELPFSEEKLYLWNNDADKSVIICQEMNSLLNQGNYSYLIILTAVRADDLLKGFEIIRKY